MLNARALFQGGRTRVALLLGLALILAADRSADPLMTAAYFVSTAANAGNNISTVTLNISTTPSGSSFFSISNMVPGDYSLNTVTIANGGTSTNQNFTYTVSSTASPSSLLDSNAPSASATSGAAILLLRCTSDAAGNTPAACTSANVYVTQVYPTAGAGTQKQMGASGLTSAALGPVSTTSGNYSIPISGTSFTGGQVAIGTPFNMGGPDSVSGADGQSKGLSFGHSDYLASIVYLPTQMGSTLQGLSSTLSFTWTATQRLGAAR